MKIYRHIVFHIFVAVLFMAAPSFAEELSDEEAYGRAHTVCSQKVYPLWRPKEGETVNKDDYALTPPRLRKIAACMREKGVPAAFDEETFSVVRTGSGFGGNVDIKVENLFPDDITVPKENPHKANKNILPDPDYSLRENTPAAAAGYDPVDARLMRELKSGDITDKQGGTNLVPPEVRREMRQRESAPSRRSLAPSRTRDVITGNENDKKGGNNDAKPIFLPR